MLQHLAIAAVAIAIMIVVRVAVQRHAARMAGLEGAQPPTSCRSGLCGTCGDKHDDATTRKRAHRPRHRS